MLLTYVFADRVADHGVWGPVGGGFLQRGEENRMVHVDLVDLIEDVVHQVTVQYALALQWDHIRLQHERSRSIYR